MARFQQVSEWLAWQETLHPSAIDLSLKRLREVMQRLGFAAPRCPIITIAGTKGKGSCAALLDSLLGAAGYRVGLFTSPHLRRYNERIRIAGQEISDASLCAAFARIDAARWAHTHDAISLTYFEFNALAAFLCFATAALDVWVLEVGMGGRLDAVNVLDADVAIVTSIGLDHTEWLGTDLNSIAREKAGIFRADRPALFGSSAMPAAIAEVADKVGARLLRAGADFNFELNAQQWSWRMATMQLDALPLPALPGEVQVANASCVLAALRLLAPRLPVSRAALEQGLRSVQLPGRLQSLIDPRTGIEWVLDVAHNALSAQVLAAHLATRVQRPTLAVLGVMADKDIGAVTAALQPHVAAWLVTALPSPRALHPALLAERLRAAAAIVVLEVQQVADAWPQATALCQRDGYERVLVFGSFLTVGPALDWLEQ